MKTKLLKALPPALIAALATLAGMMFPQAAQYLAIFAGTIAAVILGGVGMTYGILTGATALANFIETRQLNKICADIERRETL